MPNPNRRGAAYLDDFEGSDEFRLSVRRQEWKLGSAPQSAEADDGTTALPMLQSGGFDCLVTAWNMPGMRGIDLLRAVRADDRLKTLPVLMVTAEAKRDQIIEAAQAGVNGYVVKPFTAQVLKEKIEKIFERVNG